MNQQADHKPAALGFRVHSGWAAVVAVAGTSRLIQIVDRRRIDLADPSVPGPKQPYHEAEGKPLAAARRIIERCQREAQKRARESIARVTADLSASGYAVNGCGLLLASGRKLPELPAILASHALIHTADGALFRDAIATAAQSHELSLLGIPERELLAEAARTLQDSPENLLRRVTKLGKEIGPPWTQDQKLAALAGWMVLCSRG